MGYAERNNPIVKDMKDKKIPYKRNKLDEVKIPTLKEIGESNILFLNSEKND